MSPASPRLPTFAQASWWMAQLYLATLTRGRKGIIVGILLLLGLVLAAANATQPENYSILLGQLTLGFLVPFGALFYGIAVVREEVESRTLTYLLVRPLPRMAILMGRWLAAMLVTIGAMAAYAGIQHAIAAPPEGTVGAFDIGAALQAAMTGQPMAATESPVLGRVLLAAAVGAAYYTTAFTAIAVLLPRPLLFGLGYLIFWEFALPFVPNQAATLSMRFHLMNLVGLKLPTAIPFLGPAQVTFGKSLTVLLVGTALLGALSLWVFPRREYVLSRAE